MTEADLFHSNYDSIPTPVWEHDYTRLAEYLAGLRQAEGGDFAACLARMPDLVERCAKLKRVTAANPAALNLYRAANPEQLMENLTRTINPQTIGFHLQELEAVWAGRTELHANAAIRSQSGELRQITISWMARPGETPYASVLVSTADTPEREVSEQLLRSEIERATLLLELYEKALQLSDRQLYDYVLDKAVQLTGSRIGFFHRVAEDQNTIILTTWNQAALQNCTAIYETHYPLEQAGNWVDCVRQKRPLIYNDYASSPNRKGLPEGHSPLQRFITVPVVEDGLVRVIFGVGNKQEDYTERDLILIQLVANELYKIIRLRQNERALLESETRYQRLLEAANAMAWEVNDRGEFTFLSAQVKDMLGYEPAELVGRPSSRIMTLAEAKRLWALFGQYAAVKQGLANFEATFTHKNGQPVTVECSCIPILDGRDAFAGFWGVSADITRRRQAENLIRAHNAELEQRVSARTADLEEANEALHYEIIQHTQAEAQISELNKHLQQRSLALENSNRELESFAYSVSHDLRAPLRHIHGYIGMLKENLGGSLDGENLHFFKAIATAAENMSKLIDDLLSFSRMGRKEFSTQAVNLNDLTAEIIGEFQTEIKERVVEWQVASLPAVTGDPVMLRMVLVNLVSNALKFTRGRSPARIEIGVQPGLDEYVLFVSDNGVGFDMRFADKLFGVFQRLHRVEEFEGTGIGLANVRRIIARHGGRTWAESTLDRGATFYFSLPRAEK